jgi:hypothetical protein
VVEVGDDELAALCGGQHEAEPGADAEAGDDLGL